MLRELYGITSFIIGRHKVDKVCRLNSVHGSKQTEGSIKLNEQSSAKRGQPIVCITLLVTSYLRANLINVGTNDGKCTHKMPFRNKAKY